MNNIKPIVLSSSLVRIPQENDRSENSMFLESDKIKSLKKILPVSKVHKYSKILREKPGYLYSATNDHLKIPFKDCLCLLTKSTGFSDVVLSNYKLIKNFWHTNYLRYDEEEYLNQRRMITENFDETEECIINFLKSKQFCLNLLFKKF